MEYNKHIENNNVEGVKMRYKIILASNSPRRKEILSKYLKNFSIVDSGYKENLDINGNPKIEVIKAAFLKGMDVENKVEKHSIIISADTIVYDNEILGKPIDNEDAFKMLKRLSGKWHNVYTGFAIIDVNSGMKIVNYEKTDVKFFDLTDEIISNYIETNNPLDKAGAYGIQDVDSTIVEKISGDYYNVMGLPVYKISEILWNKFKIKLL